MLLLVHMGEIPKEALKFKGATREKVRAAIVRVLEEGARKSTKAISVAKVRGAGSGDQNATTELLRLWRAGWSAADSWEDQPAAAGGGDAEDLERRRAEARDKLEGMISPGMTDGEREAVAHEVIRQLAARLIDPEVAKVIQSHLGEARQQAEKRRKNEPPPEDPTRILLASEVAMKAARAIDLYVSDARRERVLAFLGAELEADALEHPNVDRGGAP